MGCCCGRLVLHVTSRGCIVRYCTGRGCTGQDCTGRGCTVRNCTGKGLPSGTNCRRWSITDGHQRLVGLICLSLSWCPFFTCCMTLASFPQPEVKGQAAFFFFLLKLRTVASKAHALSCNCEGMWAPHWGLVLWSSTFYGSSQHLDVTRCFIWAIKDKFLQTCIIPWDFHDSSIKGKNLGGRAPDLFQIAAGYSGDTTVLVRYTEFTFTFLILFWLFQWFSFGCSGVFILVVLVVSVISFQLFC